MHSAAEYILSCVVRREISLRWTYILPRVVILAGVEFRSWSDFATAGITKLTQAIETGNLSPASILHLGVVSQEAGCFTFEVILAFVITISVPKVKRKRINRLWLLTNELY